MKLAAVIVAIGLLAMVAHAQVADVRPARGGATPAPGRQDDSSALTTQQKAQVKAILSRYNASALTSTSARAINDAFRAAGLRNGPGLMQAIRDAGFDPEKIGQLDPPPSAPGSAPGSRPSPGVRGDRRPPGDANDGRQARDDGPGGPAPNGGSDARRPARDDGPGRPGQGRGYSIDQAVSDRAQLTTIAFSGLAFLTGDMGCNTFLPPGKVADFCGFQYMRDVDTNQMGHNTSFVPRAANNVLCILTDEQKAQLVTLAREQEQVLTDFAYKRFPLVKAFSRQLEGDIPSGRAGLSREAVMKYTGELYEIDGLLSYRRAEVLGGIVRSLTDKQKAYLAKLAFDNSSTWPEVPDQVDRRSMSHMAHVAVMTYASEMLSWYRGNVEADVYFCPERHATYFGSFYMKDIPAMGNPNYSISTSLTGDSGEAFLATLTDAQRELVTSLVEKQRADLAEIVRTRRAIATELRRFMQEPSLDRGKVLALSRRYGELDGEISYLYATAFAQVARTLTADQKRALLKLRNLDARYTCQGAYLYSRAIEMPQIPSTDFLFGTSGTTAAPPASVTHSATTAAPPTSTAFTLRSPAVADGGALPIEYTGDGVAATLPLEWRGAPRATRAYAVIMHHVPPEGPAKWYWLLYNIPATSQALPRNVSGVGTIGTNSVNGRTEYAPPHSKGPGPKTYVYTVYALSAPPQLDIPAADVTRDRLLAAMQGRILASAQLSVVYTRGAQADR